MQVTLERLRYASIVITVKDNDAAVKALEDAKNGDYEQEFDAAGDYDGEYSILDITQ